MRLRILEEEMRNKKLLRAVAGAAVCFTMLAGAVPAAACQTDGSQHEHTYADAWSSDDTHHWHNPTCGVVIWYDAISGKTDASGKSYGTNGSASVTVTNNATGFTACNITFKNKYNTLALYKESLKISSSSQAVVLLTESASSAFFNCKFTSYHDTLYSNKGYHYYKDCWIEGHTDFIFGQDAVSYFDNCTIYSIGAGAEEKNGGYIAAYQNTTTEFGPIFNGCDFTSDDNVKAGSIALGRAWGKEFKMVVINSDISDRYSKAAHTAGTQQGSAIAR